MRKFTKRIAALLACAAAAGAAYAYKESQTAYLGGMMYADRTEDETITASAENTKPVEESHTSSVSEE